MHTAIAFGEDDYRLGTDNGLTVVNPVRSTAPTTSASAPYAGRFVKDADPDLVEDLRARGRLLSAADYEHSYPHCWRCQTPLLYYAKPSWYIATSKLRDRLLAANETVDWHPEHIKHGRFGDWLENNVDWALSRERYWGTPLPVWRCEGDAAHIHCIGSLRRARGALRRRARGPAPALRRRRVVPVPQCAATMQRVPEVIDVWFDSGCMPFAQHHAPFENEGQRRSRRASRRTSSARRWTRRAGWFYSLLAVSTLLFGQRAVQERRLPRADPRRGRQEDVEVPGQHRRPVGCHRPLRRRRVPLVLLHLQAAVGRLPFSTEAIGEGVRLFLDSCGTPTRFYVALHRRRRTPTRDRRPSSTAGSCRAWRDRRGRHRAPGRLRRDAPAARIAAFVDDLSNWYVRRSRRRFWDGDARRLRDAARVPADRLRSCWRRSRRSSPTRSTTTSTAAEPSVHLTDWPLAGDRATSSSSRTWRPRARRCALGPGRARRGEGQAAPAAARGGRRRRRRASARRSSGSADVVREELNVKACGSSRRPTSSAPTSSRPTTARSARASASRCRRPPTRSRRSTLRTSPRRCATAAQSASTIDGHDHELTRRRPALVAAAARRLPARARGLARRRAGAHDRRRAASRGPGARDRPRASRTRARTRASTSPTASRSRSAATRSCSGWRGSSPTGSRPRRCGLGRLRGDRRRAGDDRGPAAARLGRSRLSAGVRRRR